MSGVVNGVVRGTSRGLAFLGRHATWCLALGVLSGLALPTVAEWLRPTLPGIIVFSLILSLLRIRLASLFHFLQKPLLISWQLLLVLVVTPLLVAAIIPFSGAPAGIGQAVILMAAAPPIVSASAFALILGLDAAFAILVIVLAHILVPLSLPLMALHLLGLDLNVPAQTLFIRLALLVGSAFVVAWILKRFFVTETQIEEHKDIIDGLIVVGLVLFALAIMAGVTDTIIARPGHVAVTLVIAFAANIGLQIVGAALSWWTGKHLAFTTGLLAGNCNMGMVLAVLGQEASQDVALYFALAQLPMYMLPLFVLPVYRRLLHPTPPSG